MKQTSLLNLFIKKKFKNKALTDIGPLRVHDVTLWCLKEPAKGLKVCLPFADKDQRPINLILINLNHQSQYNLCFKTKIPTIVSKLSPPPESHFWPLKQIYYCVWGWRSFFFFCLLHSFTWTLTMFIEQEHWADRSWRDWARQGWGSPGEGLYLI